MSTSGLDPDGSAWAQARWLAAVDMYGRHGRSGRRRLIVAEFVATTAISLATAAALVGLGNTGWVWLAALVLLGIAVNYAILSHHAIALRGPRLHAALPHGASTADLQRATRRSLRLLVPFLLLLPARSE